MSTQAAWSGEARRLVNSFKEYMHDKYSYYTDADAACFNSLKRYKYETALVLSASQVANLVHVVDDLINQALSDDDLRLLTGEQWERLGQEDMIPTFMLRTSIGEELFQQVTAAKAAYALDADRVEAVDFRDVQKYEDELDSDSSDSDGDTDE